MLEMRLPALLALAFQNNRTPQDLIVLLGYAMAVMAAGLYVYFAVALHAIARRTGTPAGWLAWFPILNFFLMVMVSGKSLWWFLLCLVPGLNLLALAVVWMGIAEARGKPAWLGACVIVPPITLFVPGYLAFAD